MEICAPFVTSVFWTSHQLERGQEGRSPRTWWIGRPKPRLALLQKRREPQSLTWHHLPGAVPTTSAGSLRGAGLRGLEEAGWPGRSLVGTGRGTVATSSCPLLGTKEEAETVTRRPHGEPALVAVGPSGPPRSPLAPGLAAVPLDPAAHRYAISFSCAPGAAQESSFHLPATPPAGAANSRLVWGDLLVAFEHCRLHRGSLRDQEMFS